MAASTKGSLGDLPAAFMNLMNAQMKLSADLFESLTGQTLPTIGDLNKAGKKLTGAGDDCGTRGGCWTLDLGDLGRGGERPERT
jgi:hypothetical protein